MKLILVILSLLVFQTAFAQVDYSYCDSAWNNYMRGTIRNEDVRDALKVANGRLLTENIPSHVKYTQDGDTITVIKDNSLGSDFKRVQTVIVKTKNGKVENFDVIYDQATKTTKSRDEDHLSLNVQNGICFPLKRNGFTDSNGKHFDRLFASSRLCREVNDYFNQHPEAKKCTCGTSATKKQFMNIITRNGGKIDYEADMFEKVGEQAITMVVGGYLSDCEDAGMQETVNDDRIWKTNVNNSNSETVTK